MSFVPASESQAIGYYIAEASTVMLVIAFVAAIIFFAVRLWRRKNK